MIPSSVRRVRLPDAALLLAIVAGGVATGGSKAEAKDSICSQQTPIVCYFYLSVREGSKASGTDLIQWTDTGGDEQRWNRFLFLSDPVTTDPNAYDAWNIARLRNARSGLCVTTDGVAGHALTQERCDPGNPRQLWTWSFRDDHAGEGYLNPVSGLWMDVEGASLNKGARVIGWYDNNGKKNQLWASSTGWTRGISNADYVVNDTDPYVRYTTLGTTVKLRSTAPDVRKQGYDALALPPEATGWAYAGGRPGGFRDWNNDVHYTSADDAAVYYPFNGTGIAYVSEVSDGYGQVDVYIDGALQKTVDANRPGVHNLGRQILFSVTGLPAGPHDIVLAKKGGAYMLVDAFEVYP